VLPCLARNGRWRLATRPPPSFRHFVLKNVTKSLFGVRYCVSAAAPAARPIIAPNERSKSFIANMTVSPPAITNIGATAVTIELAFSHVGNDPERARLGHGATAARTDSDPRTSLNG
jgi:hypothetical protein